MSGHGQPRKLTFTAPHPVSQSASRRGGTAATRRYSYRGDDCLTGLTATAADDTAVRKDVSLDPVGRVTAISQSEATETYRYDQAGRITESRRSGDGGPSTREFIYAGNLLRRAGRDHFHYDARGRVVRRVRKLLSGGSRVWEFTWSDDDRLLEILNPQGQRWRYLYDGLGRRIAKQLLDGDGDAVRSEVLFTWDGRRLAEQTGDSGDVTTWDYEPGGHRPLCQISAYSQAGIDREFAAIVTDLVGTPTGLMDRTGLLTPVSATDLWGAETEHGARDVCSLGLTPCPVLVLGIERYSEALVKKIPNGVTFNGPEFREVVGQLNGVPIARWQSEVGSMLRGNSKVAISLGGFDGATNMEKFMDAVRKGQGDNWRATEWEMAKVAFNHRLGNLDWSNITFYDGSMNKIELPEPTW